MAPVHLPNETFNCLVGSVCCGLLVDFLFQMRSRTIRFCFEWTRRKINVNATTQQKEKSIIRREMCLRPEENKCFIVTGKFSRTVRHSMSEITIEQILCTSLKLHRIRYQFSIRTHFHPHKRIWARVNKNKTRTSLNLHELHARAISDQPQQLKKNASNTL